MSKKVLDNGRIRLNPSLTLDEEIYKHLELWADEDDRSISGMISFLIKRAIREKYGPIETSTEIIHRRTRIEASKTTPTEVKKAQKAPRKQRAN